MATEIIQTSADGKTRITKTAVGLTVDRLSDFGAWVTMDVERYGTDNIERSYEHYSGEEAELYDDDKMEVSVERIAGYATHAERGVNLFKINISPMPVSKNAIDEIFSSETGHYVTQLGIEGCPGRWYTSSIKVIHVDKWYEYALIEVVRCLDV
jgi:hypothetical protein